jgi:archaellum component FlaC
MSTVTDNDLRELKDLINSKFEQVDRKIESLNEKIDNKFDKIFDELTTVKVEIATIKEGQNGLEKRLSNLEFIARSMVIGILVTLVSAVIKFLYPNLLG